MKTNRDFYKAIAELLESHPDASELTLEPYLLSLRARARHFKNEESISLQSFYNLLASSFDPTPETADGELSAGPGAAGFAKWDEVLERQIQNLRELKQSGQLEDKERYFGIDSPSGGRWYNFDPRGYIECGVAGSVGGWKEGDNTGRSYVSGEVATQNELGEIMNSDPRELDEPPRKIFSLTWEQLADFLWCGQQYE